MSLGTAAEEVIAELTRQGRPYAVAVVVRTVAATAAITSQDWLGDVIGKLNTTRQRMQTALTEMGFDVTPSHANFVWCTHPSGRHAELHQFLKKNQILIRYMDFPDWGDGIRISVGTDAQVDACLMMIKRYIDSN